MIPSCNFDPTNRPTLPVVCVDWCDAYAFCKWAGKRLCGGINGEAASESDPAIRDVLHTKARSARGAVRLVVRILVFCGNEGGPPALDAAEHALIEAERARKLTLSKDIVARARKHMAG